MKKPYLVLIATCFLLTGLVLFFSGNKTSNEEVLSLSGLTMGTSYQVQIVTVLTAIDAQSLALAIQDRLDNLDKVILSTFAPNSELNQFNRYELNRAFNASDELMEVILLGQEVYQQSNHHFDITIAPLVELWGFGVQGRRPQGSIPTESEIENALSSLGSESIQVSLSNSTLLKDKQVQIDLSGIAKGYGVDQVAELLEEYGVSAFLIEIGGELRVKGNKPNGESWVLGIETPLTDGTDVFATFYAQGQALAIAGSGDYRNYFEADGRHYSHEIDPTNGRPVSHQLAAVTVVAQNAAFADAYATALMIMGPEQAFLHATSAEIAAYFIMHSDSGFISRYTDTFEPFLNP